MNWIWFLILAAVVLTVVFTLLKEHDDKKTYIALLKKFIIEVYEGRIPLEEFFGICWQGLVDYKTKCLVKTR